jgi:hypothetical protein
MAQHHKPKTGVKVNLPAYCTSLISLPAITLAYRNTGFALQHFIHFQVNVQHVSKYKIYLVYDHSRKPADETATHSNLQKKGKRGNE